MLKSFRLRAAKAHIGRASPAKSTGRHALIPNQQIAGKTVLRSVRAEEFSSEIEKPGQISSAGVRPTGEAQARR